MITLHDIFEKLKRESSVALFCHVRPDGDTIGSALSLSLALKSFGITTQVFCSDCIPQKFSFLNAVKDIKKEFAGSFSAFVAIDSADTSRLGEYEKIFLAHKNTFNIDHHVSNTRYAKYNFIQDNAANCENIFELIKLLGVEINKEIADLLLMGIITDTGGFKHKNVTPNTLKVSAFLLEKGADINYITYKTFNEQSKERAKLFGTVTCKIRYFKEGRIAVCSVLQADLDASGAKPEDTEGFIDFVMGISTVEIGACVLETVKGKFKISFRSKGADVNAVASTFGGGGHILASGCQIMGDYEEVIDKITFTMGNYLID